MSLLVPAPAQQASYHMYTGNKARESHDFANAQHGNQHARLQAVFACAKQKVTTCMCDVMDRIERRRNCAMRAPDHVQLMAMKTRSAYAKHQ
eukprot:6211015-Pleurochrysis_carterae.AAC.1